MPLTLTYADRPLGFPDADGTIQRWVDRYRPVDDLFRLAVPASATDGRGDGQGTGHVVGLPRPNWHYHPPRPLLNSVWWPCTGASRFALGLFITSRVNADAIQSALLDTDGSSFLNMSDSQASVQLRMWCLPPRPLGALAVGNFSLMLIPLVDRRYFWQFAKTGAMYLGPESPWEDVQSQIVQNLGVDIEFDDPRVDGYAAPDWSGFANANENAARVLDAYCATVGQRFVADTNNTFKCQTPAVADPVAQANLEAAKVTAGGSFLKMPSKAAGTVSIIFGKRQGGILYGSGQCDVRTRDNGETDASGNVTIHTSYQADYSSGQSEADNTPFMANLADAIASSYYEWRRRQYGGTIMGCAGAWQPTGFDDYLWFQFGTTAPDDIGGMADDLPEAIVAKYRSRWLAQTVVECLPHNFGVTENLCQGPPPGAPRTFRPMQVFRAELTADFFVPPTAQDPALNLPAFANAKILFGGSFLKPPGVLSMDDFPVRVFDTMKQRGSAKKGSRVWVSCLAADTDMFELIGGNAETMLWVKIIALDKKVGDLIKTDDGFFFGTVMENKGPGDAQLIPKDVCRISFVDYGDDGSVASEMIAEVGRIYGPCKTSAVTIDGLPLLEATIVVQEFDAKTESSGNVKKGETGTFELYNQDESPSGIKVEAKAKYNPIASGKWCVVVRRGRSTLVANQIECGGGTQPPIPQ